MTEAVDQDSIVAYIATTFHGVDVQRPTDGVGSGDIFFIYDPDGNLEPKRQFPFATLVTKNYGDFDSASDLDRLACFG